MTGTANLTFPSGALELNDRSLSNHTLKRRKTMTQFSCLKIPHAAVLSLIAFTLLGTTVTAQTTKVEGLIQSRNGDTMTLKTSQTPEIVVLLTDSTDVGQVQG